MIQSAFPILEVPDLDTALRFYRDTLGGELRYRFPDEGDPVYVSLQVGESTLGIGLAEDPDPPAGIVLWFYVDDVDAVTDAVRSSGLEVVEEPADQPWGERVSLVIDPFGMRVRFGAAVASTG
ncbi:MAG: glyoxalase superfamily protein [Leifsonia sp.]